MTELLEKELKLASRKRRIAAYVIDHFSITLLLTFTIFLSLGSDFIDQTDENINSMGSRILMIMLPGFFLYLAKDSIKGISIGKWIMGIMVRDANDSQNAPSIGRLFLRNLPMIIWPVEFIVLATNREKKRLGDNMATTIVVQNPNKPTKLPRISTLLGIAVIFMGTTFLFISSAMKNSEAYQMAIYEIEQNQEIIDETGGIIGYGMFPLGSVNISNGNGLAYLDISVLGNDKDLDLSLHLTKRPGESWKLIEMNK